MNRALLAGLPERRRAFEYLVALDDPLAAAVLRAGTIDAYKLSVAVSLRDPFEWLAFAIVGQQISRAAAKAIFGRLQEALAGRSARPRQRSPRRRLAGRRALAEQACGPPGADGAGEHREARRCRLRAA
jgi:hypothetical protein